MRRVGLVVIALVLVGMASLLGPAGALAQGSCSGSAGDQQYCDPLGNGTGSSSSHSGSSSSSGSTPSSTLPESSSSSTTTAASTAPPSSNQDPSSTLPYTGLDIRAAALVGIGLLATGCALRRSTRRAL